MKYGLKLKEEALGDLSEAYRFYEKENKGRGEDFLSCIEAVFERIKTYPYHYPEKYYNKRSAVVRKYPYVIIYEIEEDVIIVYSVFHTSRNPKVWKGRN